MFVYVQQSPLSTTRKTERKKDHSFNKTFEMGIFCRLQKKRERMFYDQTKCTLKIQKKRKTNFLC